MSHLLSLTLVLLGPGPLSAAVPCVPLLEAPIELRVSALAQALDRAVAVSVPELLNVLHVAPDARAGEARLDQWVDRLASHPAVARARALERRRRDERLAGSFGRADGLIDELSLIFADFNQSLRRERAPRPPALNFSDMMERMFEEPPTPLTVPPPTDLATALREAPPSLRNGPDTGARVTALSRVIDAYLRLRDEVTLAHDYLLDDRAAPDRARQFDERMILGSLARALDVPAAPDLKLAARRARLGETLERYEKTIDNGCLRVERALGLLGELTRLARATLEAHPVARAPRGGLR